MNVSLPPELEAPVRPHAGPGMYALAGASSRDGRAGKGSARLVLTSGSRSLTTFCLSALFALPIFLVPVAARAVELGELSLLSKIGQPLYATVDIKLAEGETIDDACLSLAEDPASTGSRELLGTGLSLTVNKAAHKIEIRSKRVFKEPSATFRLRVRCAGAARAVAGVFALLPDPDPATPVSLHAVPKPAPVPKAALSAENMDSPSANEPSPLPLKVADGQLDMSRVGQLGPADLEALLAQRKLLDEDDQTAHLLALQQRFNALNEELRSARLKLAKLEAGKTSAVSPPEVAGGNEPLVSALTSRNVLLLSGVLGLMTLGYLGIRSFRKMKARSPAPASAQALPAQTLAKPGGTTLRIVHPQREKQTQPIKAAAVPADRGNQPEEIRNKEEKTVLEEAELYAVYGHPDKAVKILLEFVAQTPQSEDAWMLLLSIYSASLQVREFENAARQFLANGKNSPHWKMIQALGRTLDKDNELYSSNGNGKDALWLPSSVSRHRPIGDILIELGYLSAQDLAHCLGEFDPKQHGRFGHYLLTRRIINHAQLNEALLKQQINQEAKPDARPDLPQQAAVQDEALPGNDLLSAESGAHIAPPATAHVQDNAFPLDFVIDDGTEKPAGNEPAAPGAENKSRDLEFHLELDLLPAGNKPRTN